MALVASTILSGSLAASTILSGSLVASTLPHRKCENLPELVLLAVVLFVVTVERTVSKIMRKEAVQLWIQFE